MVVPLNETEYFLVSKECFLILLLRLEQLAGYLCGGFL